MRGEQSNVSCLLEGEGNMHNKANTRKGQGLHARGSLLSTRSRGASSSPLRVERHQAGQLGPWGKQACCLPALGDRKPEHYHQTDKDESLTRPASTWKETPAFWLKSHIEENKSSYPSSAFTHTSSTVAISVKCKKSMSR